MAGVSAQHIAPQSGGFEPQRSFDFQVELYGVPGAEVIQLSIMDVAWPVGRNDSIVIDYFAEQRKVAGKLTFDDSRITCVDYIDENTLGVLQAWRALVIDVESGALGYASQYKREASVVLLGPDGNRSRVMRMIGVWPQSVSADNISMASNDHVSATINLVYDIGIPEF